MTTTPYPPTWQEVAERCERDRAAADAPTTYASVHGVMGVKGATTHAHDNSVAIKVDGRVFRIPPWQTLLAEGVHVRSCFTNNDGGFGILRGYDAALTLGHGGTVRDSDARIRGREAFEKLYTPGSHSRVFGTITPPPAEAFTITNAQHFQFLPSVERIKQSAVQLAMRLSSLNVSPAMTFAQQFLGDTGETPNLLSAEQRQNVETVVRAEQSHMLYHKAMWRAHGRRVAVLDETTYTLLAHTDLPAMPANVLAAPWPSFYIKLPPRSFEFEVYDVRTQNVDRRYAEGVCVAIDHVEPEHDGPRELAFMVMGCDEGDGTEGRNCAFATIRFGPDALLSDFALGGAVEATHARQRAASLAYGSDQYAGAQQLTVHIPRVIIGLMLYLASEHPDVVPVPPAERRTFTEVRSPAQRAMALARQDAKLRSVTRLPVLVIGSHIDAHAREYAARLATADRTRAPLDRKVHVRGHWHWYRVGVGRAERVHKWIKPYEYGPDMAESMIVRAARVPRAKMNPDRR